MRAGLHETAKAPVRRAAVVGDMDNPLQLEVIEQKAGDGSVITTGETLPEAIQIKAHDARPANEPAATEPHLAILAEQVDNFLIEAFVQVIAVGILQFPDGLLVLQQIHLVAQPLQLRVQLLGLEFLFFRHGSPCFLLILSSNSSSESWPWMILSRPARGPSLPAGNPIARRNMRSPRRSGWARSGWSDPPPNRRPPAARSPRRSRRCRPPCPWPSPRGQAIRIHPAPPP